MPSVCNQKGSVLLLIVFLIFFLALFVISISDLTTTDFQIARNNKLLTMAFYVAEAGIERSIYKLRQNNSWSAGFNQVQFPTGENSYYTVTVTNPSSVFVTLDSTGTVQDDFKRRIIVKLKVLPTSVPYPIIINSWEEAAP